MTARRVTAGKTLPARAINDPRGKFARFESDRDVRTSKSFRADSLYPIRPRGDRGLENAFDEIRARESLLSVVGPTEVVLTCVANTGRRIR